MTTMLRAAMIALCLAAGWGIGYGKDQPVSTALFARPKDLIDHVPADFPRFHFAGHDEEAQLLSRYLYYHFSKRLGNSPTLFNKEYLTTSDLWMGGAIDRARVKSIQDVHREDLSLIKMDAEGYVYTHQHISHAHDHGWPFPFWTQADAGPDLVKGKAAGWHFQANMPDYMMIAGSLKGWNRPEYYGPSAANGWELHNVKSLGVSNEKWQLEVTGQSPHITTPDGMSIEAFHSPYLQLRWAWAGDREAQPRPYVEWLCEGDTNFGGDRRVYVDYDEDTWMHTTKSRHLMFTMYRHPKWTGKIMRMRIHLAPGESEGKVGIDSFFTVYDTRHTINNPIYLFACWNYFRWTGDIEFLRANVDRMRRAILYQQTVMGGLKHKRIRNEWPGHDGIAAWTRNPDGSRTIHGGHGIGNNYWDILPFGWDDLYATNQYYAALLDMADVEDAILANPGWGIPRGACALDPAELRAHAVEVKREANRLFWNSKTGRFYGWIDKNGNRHDYGFTFLNLDSIWYDLASEEHARAIVDWVGGRRVVEGDTSTGADIYHWRFGPRATTKRNTEVYIQGWTYPEGIEWGGQVQDGGAVLGFSFYDLWARLMLNGPDDAWKRLTEILAWDKEVHEAGGYRKYYGDGSRGTTLQGGGTAGGLGIDAEFFESSLVPSIVTLGFLGLDPTGDSLRIRPHLPKDCPEMGISNLLYRGVKLDVKATDSRVTIGLKEKPQDPLIVEFIGEWVLTGRDAPGSRFSLDEPGIYAIERRAR